MDLFVPFSGSLEHFPLPHSGSTPIAGVSFMNVFRLYQAAKNSPSILALSPALTTAAGGVRRGRWELYPVLHPIFLKNTIYLNRPWLWNPESRMFCSMISTCRISASPLSDLHVRTLRPKPGEDRGTARRAARSNCSSCGTRRGASSPPHRGARADHRRDGRRADHRRDASPRGSVVP